MKNLLYVCATFAAEHGYAEWFVRSFHALTGYRHALQRVRVTASKRR